jgi:hypothetical protein
MVAELDHGHCLEHSLVADNEVVVSQRINVALDEE